MANNSIARPEYEPRSPDSQPVAESGPDALVGKSFFREGDLALLIDRKERRYLVTLENEGTFYTHVGALPHKEIIGEEHGRWYRTSHGQTLLGLKPTLADCVLELPRGAQVIYPKDLGSILIMADIFPGARVVEGGLGSGALTATLLRAVGQTGRVITYEIREDMVKGAMSNLRALASDPSCHTLRLGDIYKGIEEKDVDRVVLDVPEPWHVVPWAAQSLVMGGILLSFLPTILQVHQLTQVLHSDSRYQLIETVEIMLRPWNVSQRSVRPAHRMVAHTGFITTARRCAPKAGATESANGGDGREGLEEE